MIIPLGMGRYIVSRTSTQQIAIEAENAHVAGEAAAQGKGDVIASNTSYNARVDTRNAAQLAAASAGPAPMPKPDALPAVVPDKPEATAPPVPTPKPAPVADRPPSIAAPKPAASSKTQRSATATGPLTPLDL